MRRIIPRGTASRSCAVRTTLSCNLARNFLRSVFAYAQKRWNCNKHISITERLTGKLRATLFSNHPQDLTGSARTTGATGNASPRPEPRHTDPAPRTHAHRSRARNRQRRSPGIPTESRGWERRRRDLNPRGAMHPYLLSREAHSTGLCDVSNADYSKAFSSQTRNALRPYCCRNRGGQGIRTPGAIADTTVFKTVTFGHSVSPPDPPIIADLELFAHSSSRICNRSPNILQ